MLCRSNANHTTDNTASAISSDVILQGPSSAWKVISVAVKVFLCQKNESFIDVANCCNGVLLKEAQGEIQVFSLKMLHL